MQLMVKRGNTQQKQIQKWPRLPHKGFIITMINMLKDLVMINMLKGLVENVDNRHLKMGNFSRELKTVMKNNMEMQQMRNTIWKRKMLTEQTIHRIKKIQ